MNSSAPLPLVFFSKQWADAHPNSTARMAESFEVVTFDLFRISMSIAALRGRTIDLAIVRIEWLDAVLPLVQALKADGTDVRHIVATEQTANLIPRHRLDYLGVCGIITETGTHEDVLNGLFNVIRQCNCGNQHLAFSTRLTGFEVLLGNTQIDEVDRGILTLVSEGLTNEEIARAMHYSNQTIRNRLSALLRLTGSRNRTELAHLWRRYNITKDIEDSSRSRSDAT